MTINLGTITQGERGTLSFNWEFPVVSPVTISGAVITAVMKLKKTGDVTAVTGTLTGTGATAVTWVLSAGDSGTAGAYQVVFKAVVGGTNTYTLAATLNIAANPAVTAVQNPPLIGVALVEAEFLFDLYTAAAAAAAGELAKSDGDGGIVFEAGGSGNDVADLTTAGLDAGDMFRVAVAGGLESQTPAQVLTNIGAETAGAAATAQTAAQDYADSAVSTHEADTSVHGIADTSLLLDTADIGDTVASQNHAHDYVPEDAAILSKVGAYELAAGDEAKIIECDGSFTITCPDGLDAGFQVALVNVGSGVITIAAATTLQSKGAAVTIDTQYAMAVVYHRGSNVWLLAGDIA